MGTYSIQNILHWTHSGASISHCLARMGVRGGLAHGPSMSDRHVDVRVCVSERVCVCMHVRASVHVRACMCECACMHVHACACMCESKWVSVCMGGCPLSQKRFGKENLPQPTATPLACGLASVHACVQACVWACAYVGMRACASKRVWVQVRKDGCEGVNIVNCQVKQKKNQIRMKMYQWSKGDSQNWEAIRGEGEGGRRKEQDTSKQDEKQTSGSGAKRSWKWLKKFLQVEFNMTCVVGFTLFLAFLVFTMTLFLCSSLVIWPSICVLSPRAQSSMQCVLQFKQIQSLFQCCSPFHSLTITIMKYWLS